MKNTSYAILAVLFVVLTFTPNILAQDSPQWHLPDGVKARYGKGTIYDIKYSPDGAKMAVATGIGIWIYDTETADELNLLTGHAKAVSSIAFSPDGATLASGSYDATVRLWGVENGREIHTLTAHTKAVKTVAFSPDGTTLASGSYDETVRLWDVATGIERHTLKGHTRSVYDVAFNHDGTMLASASVFDAIRLWEVANGTEIRTITAGQNGAFSVAFSPVTNTFASGVHDKTVRLWDAATGTELHTLEGHTHHVSHVVFSRDGDVLASATGSHWDTTIRLWHADTGTELHTFTGHTGGISELTFNPSGDILTSASADNSIRLWDVNTGTELRTFVDHTTYGDIHLHPDRKVQVSVNADYSIRLWDSETGTELSTLIGHTHRISSIAFSPDNTMLASGSWDGTLRLWEVATGTQLYTFIDNVISGIDDIAFSPDGKKIAALHTFMNSSVYLFDVETGVELRAFRVYTQSPLSRIPATYPINEHHGSVNRIVFNPDGKSILTIGCDDTIRLWEVATGNFLNVLEGHTDSINDVKFNPDGTVLATGSSDNTIRLWDVQSWMEIQTLTTDTHSVHSVAFSPDGNTLASGGYDGTIRLWDIASGMTYRTFKGHTSSVSTTKYSSDGQTLVSRSSDGTVLVWDLTPVEPINTIVSLSPVSVQSPAIGENLVFMLNIAEGRNVAGYQATVSFDHTALRYVESANGDYLPAPAFSIPTVVNDNFVTFATTTFADESNGDGMLATITFEVVAIKVSTVRLSNVVLTNNLGESAKPIIADAEIIQPQQRDEDVNEDGTVDITDLMLVASNFDKTGENAADVNDDGIVNIVDLTLVAAAIGNADAVAPALWNVNSDDMLPRATVTAWLQEARQLNSADPTFQRGVLVLESLLKVLTPKDTALLPNYPNPFNPETWIPYQLAEPAEVSISVYAADGKLVRTLDLGHQPIDIYHQRNRAAHWNGCNEFGEPVASGVYFYTLKAGEFSATRKMLIKK